MAQYTVYNTYSAWFSDPDEYNAIVELIGDSRVTMTPKSFADNFEIPYPTVIPTEGIPAKGISFASSIASPGDEFFHPLSTGIFSDDEVFSVLVPGQIDTYGNLGPDMLVIWACNIYLIPANAQADDQPTDRAPIPLRRWIAGYEANGTAEGGSDANNRSRDSSRTVDGMGWCIRDSSSSVTDARNLADLVPGLTSNKSRERFYVRVRNFSVVDSIQIWTSRGTINATSGGTLFIGSAGELFVVNLNVGTGTLIATIPSVFVKDVWVLIDVIITYASGAGRISIYLNHTLAFETAALTDGLGSNQNHRGSTLGFVVGVAGWELDFDDWINSEIPHILGVETLNSLDWLFGSHVKTVKVNSGTDVNWTGEVQSMNQMMAPINVTAGSKLVSSTSLARLTGITDASNNNQDVTSQTVGAVSALVSSYSRLASGTTSGQLGYSLALAAEVLAPIVETSSPRYNQLLYPGLGTDIVPSPIEPLKIIYEKGASSVAATVSALTAFVEYIGAWGLEDSPDSQILSDGVKLIHNAFFDNIAWAYTGPVQDGPVAIMGGTYTGNDTTQSIEIPLPCHMVWIRPLTGGSGGIKWFGGSLGGHTTEKQPVIPDSILRVDHDVDTGITSFTVVGTNPNCNAVGVTYQYIVFMDPAMRFNLCGAFAHEELNPATDDLPIDGFIGEACFINPDFLGNTNDANLSFRGPGNGSMEGNRLSGTVLTDFIDLAAGEITSGDDAHFADTQSNYSLWRSVPTSPLALCRDAVAVQIYSYTGDGLASRVVNSTPASSAYPLLVYVQPANNVVGYTKDPSDSGAVSRKVTDGSPTSTAIIGVGIDTITVGSTINSNGVVYNVFIIIGSPDAFENGTFFIANCLPDALVADPVPGADVFGLSEGGLILGDIAGGSTPITILKDVSGIYVLTVGKRNDTLYDRITEEASVDVAIPNPMFKTGFIGG